MTHHHAPRKDGDFIIGYHVGPYGRWVRLIFAIYFLVFFVVNPLVLNSQPLDDFLPFALQTLMWVGVVTGAYLVVFYFLGELLLAKMNPWVGTLVFLGAPTIVGLLGYMPQQVQIAFGVYVPLSLILIFFMKYGGCEVIALPSLILRRRYTMYCPYNAIDAVERGVTPDRGKGLELILAMVSLTITLFVGSWFLFVERGRMLTRYGVDWHIDERWALLLLFPALHLAWRALATFFRDKTLRSKEGGKYALGATILGLYVVVFFKVIAFQTLWLGAMGFGALYALYEIVQFATGRKKFRKQTSSQNDAG